MNERCLVFITIHQELRYSLIDLSIIKSESGGYSKNMQTFILKCWYVYCNFSKEPNGLCFQPTRGKTASAPYPDLKIYICDRSTQFYAWSTKERPNSWQIVLSTKHSSFIFPNSRTLTDFNWRLVTGPSNDTSAKR